MYRIVLVLYLHFWVCTDTRWPSVNQPVFGQGAADCWQWQVFTFSSHQCTVIMVYSFIWNPLKTLKDKEISCNVDMNQAFLHIQYRYLASLQKGCDVHSMSDAIHQMWWGMRKCWHLVRFTQKLCEANYEDVP